MSQQVTKEKYSIETLRERNVSYDHQHWLTQEDVDMANSYVELIERTRSKITPQIGDRLVYVTEHGDYYGNALIDSRSAKEGYLSVCEQPYVPFVWEEDGNIRLVNVKNQDAVTKVLDMVPDFVNKFTSGKKSDPEVDKAVNDILDGEK